MQISLSQILIRIFKENNCFARVIKHYSIRQLTKRIDENIQSHWAIDLPYMLSSNISFRNRFLKTTEGINCRHIFNKFLFFYSLNTIQNFIIQNGLKNKIELNLTTLSTDHKAKNLNQYINYCLIHNYHPVDFIVSLFQWDKTEEGEIYWATINHLYNDNLLHYFRTTLQP